MGFNFVTDRVISGKIYPALARHEAVPYTTAWREFIQHWPYTVPHDLIEHCDTHGYAYQVFDINDDFPNDSWYLISIGFFDFSIDYLDLVSELVKQNLQQARCRLLFYYDEGDNPLHIKTRLDQLCQAHALPLECYHFISANSAANRLPRFCYLAGDELLFWHRNRDQHACSVHATRHKKFTALNRTHKWWRATVMADLYQSGLLQHSHWSYNTDLALHDDPADNPIETEVLGLDQHIKNFIAQGPYTADELDPGTHNDHSLIVPGHFEDSFCHLVIETHFDADQSAGVFLTEKTFKAIKHGQPFVIIGCANSLAQLRQLGYRTFDHAIDNSYDLIQNNSARWLRLKQTIHALANQDMQSWFTQVKADVIHNQNLFLSTKWSRLNILHDKLLHQLATS